MALTTVQGVIDGMLPDVFNNKNAQSGSAVGRIITPWYSGGYPLAASVNAAGMSGVALSGPTAGAYPFTNHPTGETILSGATARNVGGAAMLILIDRLWHNSGINMTLATAQTINSVAWPARDVNQSTNGEGVYIAAEVTGATGAGTPTLSMTYTNSGATGSRAASNILATFATAGQGNFFVMGLAAGDTGVRSVQDFTLSATWASGSIALVAFRVIACIPLHSGTTTPTRLIKRVEDAVTLCAPRIWNDSVLQPLILVGGTAGAQVAGNLRFSQG